MAHRTPLALFVYNRPAHTLRALTAIARMHRLEEVDLHLFCDAPKREKDARAVEEVRAVVRDFAGRHRAAVVTRSENFGLARSIAGAVSELVAAEGRVVVLEDDLVPTPDFLSFMLDGLERFRDEPRVMQVAGCLLPGSVPAATDGVFLPLTTTWGWATWDRAWRAFSPVRAEDRAALDADAQLRRRFTAEGRADYVSMLDDRLAGRNDSWGILWWFAVARAGGLTLYPRQSLIWNGGFDASGVHCGGTEVFRAEPPPPFEQMRIGAAPRLPGTVEVDAAAWRAVLDFLAPPPSVAEGTSTGWAAGILRAARRLAGRS